MDKKKLVAKALLVLGIAAVAVSASTPSPIVHQVCDAVIKLIAAMGISLPISLVGGGTAKADPNKTPVPALLPLLLLPALLAQGCAPTTAYVAARQIETGAAQFVDTSADLWHQYSHAKLEQCKDKASDLAGFTACATDWEQHAVAVADKAIVDARLAVRSYDDALNAADAVKAKDFSAATAKLVTAVTDMVELLNGFGVSVSSFKVVP